MKQKAKITNWNIHQWGTGNTYILTGKISDHPKQINFHEEWQHTSELISIDFKNHTAETLNTIYTLVDNDNL